MRFLVVASLFAAFACAKSATPPRITTSQAPLPQAAYTHYLRGRIAAIEGDHGRSVQEFRLASTAAPREVTIRMALGEALYRAGKPEQACKLVERAQVEWPEHAEVWTLSGRINRGLGRDKQAAAAFARAIELDPKDETAHLGLAASWISLRDLASAEKAYRALLRHHPLSVQGNYLLGARLLARGDAAGAQPLFNRALERDPDLIPARVALARSQRAVGDPERAAETLREAFSRSGGNADVGEELFYQLLELADRASALALLRELDHEGLESGARLSFGHLYLEVGEPALALALTDSLLQKQPGNGEARLLRAQALRALGRSEEAIPLLLAVEPQRIAYPEARALAAELLAQEGKFERALEVVAEGNSKRPGRPELVIAEARTLELSGRTDRARAVFEAAVGAHKDDADLLYAFGSLEDRLGNRDRAVELVERILNKDPENSEALNFVGYSLADRNIDLERAEQMLRRAMELAPGNGYVLDSYGWLLFRRGKLEIATEVLARAHLLAPAQAEILWHLGELHLARNQRERALDWFERARALSPDDRVKEQLEARIHSLRAQK